MMTDEQMLHFFSRFQTLRHETAGKLREKILRHDNYKLPEGKYHIRSLVFGQMADDFTNGLIGELNRFAVKYSSCGFLD